MLHVFTKMFDLIAGNMQCQQFLVKLFPFNSVISNLDFKAFDCVVV